MEQVRTVLRALEQLAKSIQSGRLRPRLHKRLGALLLLALAAAVALLAAFPVNAAVQLEFFRATPTDFSVQLAWATLHEYNVEGFEILCKKADAPESSYHVIGTRLAQGNPDLGASYSFDVTGDLGYGKSYCFRLQEVTTDDTPGEVFDLCGYGPGVTPTPYASQVAALAGTPTAVIVQVPPDSSPAPTLFSTVVPGSETATPVGGISPLETPTPNPFGISPLATPAQPLSPLETPAADAAALQATQTTQAELAAAFTPTWTPWPVETSTEIPTWTPLPSETPTETPTETPAPALVVVETATPMFVVVTETPTAVAAAALAPTMTPLPMATAPPSLGFLSLLAPTTQNLMMMMLCLVFLSASGLGALGLVATILFLRSQAQRNRLEEDLLRRRRL